jgi:hypothetical protein
VTRRHRSTPATTPSTWVIRIVASFEPGEYWFWDYRAGDYTSGPALAPPVHHPLDQTTPGPEDRVPDNWQEQLH